MITVLISGMLVVVLLCEQCVVFDYCCFWFFFFKQKTAYEMRISDWSSDVCSSDLQRLAPLRAGLEAGLRRWMGSQVDDPETREDLIPEYGFGCKRPSMSNTYLRTFNQENVELITTPITSVTPTGVRTEDGTLHKADVLICATGFHVMSEQAPSPFLIHGRGGVELGEFWLENRFHAYQGVSVCGFPNMFSVMGPYGFVVGSYF